jgi:hypothetical protein
MRDRLLTKGFKNLLITISWINEKIPEKAHGLFESHFD